MLRELFPVIEKPAVLRRPLVRFEHEMEGLMEALMGRWEGFVPRVNVAETEKSLEVTAELPGLKPEEVHVEMRNGELWISGERKEESEEKGKTFHRIERRHGEFRRVIPLPTAVEEAKVEAKVENGVLKVVLPKTEASKARAIEVKAS